MEIKRNRKVGSVKNELVAKARESMLCAVEIFNNPNITFKSESFIVLAIIAWTYLMHAYYRGIQIDYRYYKLNGTRKKFDKTKKGAYRYWELEHCLDNSNCPIDNVTKSNLKFLIGLRHEIEHQMTKNLDDLISARFQACCVNFNNYIKIFFGEDSGVDRNLSISLQFLSFSQTQVEQLNNFSYLSKNIASYIESFDNNLSQDEFNDPRFAFRVCFVQKLVNHKGQADKVVEFISPNSPYAQGLTKDYVILKESEKRKYIPSEIVSLMKEKGFIKFSMHKFIMLWKQLDAKDPSKGYGVKVSRTWYWYNSWLAKVEEYCNANIDELS